MTINKPIFDSRTDTDEKIQPTSEELEAFLANAGKEGGEEQPLDGLSVYRQLLKDADDFEQRLALDEASPDIRQRILFGVLDHTQVLNPVLQSEVELYAYHLHRIESLDFKSPSVFIKSAEHEMSRLNTKKINDVMRMKRLQEMIAERKKVLVVLKKQWLEIIPELRRIALYVRENLSRIEKLCEASIVILAEAGIGRTKEKQLIEDIHNYFRDLLKRALQQGKITRENLEKARDGIETITMELSSFISEDGDALTKLYETIYNNIKTVSQDIASVLADIESKKSGTIHENIKLFKRLEQVLMSLLSGCRLEVKLATTDQSTPHDSLLNAKRIEMIAYLFEQVKKERRIRSDRRVQTDRRKANDPNYRGPERRRGGDRRSGKGRRN
jgi:hypothetical protein